MAIEDVAHETPEKIFKIHVNIHKGLTDDDLKDVGKNLGLPNKQDELKKVFKNMYRLMIEKDADMVEINPLVQLKDKSIMAVDAKVTIDDNAAF